MSTSIKVPTLGESITEATVAKWFKSVGDAVAVDEALVELETDKVTVEVYAPAAGTLAEIAADEGSEVEVGGTLGSIAEGAGAPAAKPAKKEAPAPEPSPPPAPEAPPRGSVLGGAGASRELGSVLDADEEDSGGIRSSRKLEAKVRTCPHLGGRGRREDVKDFPVATNVCYAAESKEKKLLRTIILPYSPISAQRQREFCLSTSHPRCPIFQAKEKQAGKA